MKGLIFRPKHLAIMICWLALTGCLGGPSAPTNFYASVDADIRIACSTCPMAFYMMKTRG